MRKKLIVLLCILIITIVGIFTYRIERKIFDKEQKIEEKVIRSDFGETRIALNPEKVPKYAQSRDDTLVIGINILKGTFNPIYSNYIYDNWINNLIFEGLITNDVKGMPTEKIASSWTISQDGKTYTFKIRDNIKFSDGTPLTVEDVKFTYTALCDPGYSGPYGTSFKTLEGYEEYSYGNAKEVSGIKIIDNNEISFKFKEIKASAIYDFSIGILPKNYYSFQKGNIKILNEKLLRPMGTGPYILTSYKAGVEVAFIRNENYWKGSPKINNILMKINNSQSDITDLVYGCVDIARVAAIPENVSILNEAGFLDMHFFDDNGFQYIGLNLRKDKFKDKKVRKALTYGLNREKFVQDYYGEYGSVFNVPFGKFSWAYPTEELNEYRYDKDIANKMLEESGWILREDGFRYNDDGERFTINWVTYEGNIYVQRLLSRVKEDWRNIGVEIIDEIIPFEVLIQRVFESQDFDMYNMAWALGIDPDPSLMFALSEEIPGGYNAVGWRNPDGEKLIQLAVRELDINKRKIIYSEWARIVNDELPYIYINQNKELYAVNCRVKGVQLSPYVDWTENIHKLYIYSK